MKARPVWLLTLPILLLGETAGHVVFARILEPGDPRHRLFDLAAVVAVLAVLSLAALVARAATSLRTQRQPLPSWRLAAIPAFAFLAQEHIERFVAEGDAGWLTATEPLVLAGVALQLAIGAATIWLARSLLRAADSLGLLLSRRSTRRRTTGPARIWPFEATPVRLPVLASRQAGRAPPVAA
jgi:hypothetical protein